MVELSKLTFLDARIVWGHEAHGFTPWLLDNAEELARVLGIDIELTAAEHPVGSFSLDLIGRDLTNSCRLIVENQLTATDHDHLGKLLTYAAGTDAGTIVWLATEFREEHRQAIDFLNDLGGGDARFFGVRIGVVQIDTSSSAPLFDVVSQPNDWHAQVSAASRATELSGRGALYADFWGRFIERVREERPDWSRARKPQPQNWFDMPAPIRGAHYSVTFAQGNRLSAQLYIGDSNADDNLQLYQHFEAQRAAIEEDFGDELSWEALPERLACRIAYYGSGDVADIDSHDAYLEWFLDKCAKLRGALEHRGPADGQP